MFADYGDFGRSRFRRIAKAVTKPVRVVAKPVASVAKAVAKPVVKTAKVVAKPALKLAVAPIAISAKLAQKAVGAATGAMAKPQQVVEEQAPAEQYIEQPTMAVSTPMMDQMTTAQIPTSMPSIVPQQMPVAYPQAQPVQQYMPPQQYYMPTAQMNEEAEPELPYYSEESMPVAEEEAMPFEFDQQEMEQEQYPDEFTEFEGFGLDADTLNIIKEASTNSTVQKAIEAGNNYVKNISPGQVTTTPDADAKAVIAEQNKAANIPMWMWLGLGLSLAILASGPTKKKR